MSTRMPLLSLFSLLYSVDVLILTYSSVFSLMSLAAPAAEKCTLRNRFEPCFVADGDYVIGGIFPLHYNQEMPDLNCTYKPPPVKCNG